MAHTTKAYLIIFGILYLLLLSTQSA